MNDLIVRLHWMADAFPSIWKRRSRGDDDTPVEELLTPVISNLEFVADQLCSEVRESHIVKRATNVVHYTSLKAAMSMLEVVANEVSDDNASGRSKAAFRLYDTVHLNDPDEGRYLFRRLARHYEWFGDSTLRKAFVGSFITPIDRGASDNLAFWRAYGRDGTGCSLSLHVPSDMALGVRYGSEEADKTTTRLKPLLEPLNRIVETAQTRVDRAAVRTVLANAVAKSLEPIRYLYKSDAYAYEKECRVVRLANDNQRQVRFECQTPYGSPAYIRHYCEPDDLLLRKLLVSGTSIVIGPRVPEPESVKSCFETLRNRAKLGSTIRLSKILYQSF